MNLFSSSMLRLVSFVLLLIAPAMAQAQTFSWKAPETVPVGKAYTVSVSCIEAASVVLLKDGVIVATGAATAAVRTTERVAGTVTYTVHASGGTMGDEGASDLFTVEVIQLQPAVSVAPVRSDSAGTPQAAPAPATPIPAGQ